MGGSTTTTSSSGPTGWAAQAGTSINQAGQNILNTPFQAYGGQGVAPLTANQNQALSMASAGPGVQGYYDSANKALSNAAGMNWNAGTAQQYMSPYVGAALNPVAQQMATQFAQQNLGANASSIANGAFGGDRQRMLQGYNQGQQGLAIGNMYAQGYEQAYNNAEGQFNADRTNQLNSAYGFGSLGNNQLNAWNTQFGNLMSSGGAAQQTNQANNAWNYEQFMRQQQYPYQVAQEYSGLISGLPYSQQGTNTQPGGSPFGQILGGASALGGLYSNLGGASGISSMFSDRRLKTDIKQVGKLDNGLPVYRYRYKGHPQVQIGVMAQDVEKKDFGAVVEHPSGFKMVDYRRASSPHFGSARRRDRETRTQKFGA